MVGAIHDRRYFHETLAREVARAQRDKRRLALIVFDLDDFKSINDRVGHLAGDAVLAEVAERIRDVVRPMDIACRVGGDEFSIILPGSTLADAEQLYRRIQENVSARPIVHAGTLLLSAGITELRPQDDPVGFFQRADDALYRAKSATRQGTRLRQGVCLVPPPSRASPLDKGDPDRRSTVAALSRSIEAFDVTTARHGEDVAALATALGAHLGYSAADLDAIEIGALLHDIGKIGVPKRILHKPGPLDEDEWNVMKEHPVISEHILSEVDLHPFVAQIARHSHERIDGTGYPEGLEGDAIPMPARIVFVASAFDELTTDRPYRKACTAHAALEEIRANAGTQFCPHVVAALGAVAPDISAPPG